MMVRRGKRHVEANMLRDMQKEEAQNNRNAIIEKCARALEQEAGDQGLIHVTFATQTIRALKDK